LNYFEYSYNYLLLSIIFLTSIFVDCNTMNYNTIVVDIIDWIRDLKLNIRLNNNLKENYQNSTVVFSETDNIKEIKNKAKDYFSHMKKLFDETDDTNINKTNINKSLKTLNKELQTFIKQNTMTVSVITALNNLENNIIKIIKNADLKPKFD